MTSTDQLPRPGAPDRTDRAGTALNAVDVRRHFGTVRADVNYQIAPDLKLLSFAYATRQDFTRWFSRPANSTTWRQREENYDRSVFGAGTSLNGRTQTRLISRVRVR